MEEEKEYRGDREVALFVSQLAHLLTRTQITSCLEQAKRESDRCVPDSYSMAVAVRLLEGYTLSGLVNAAVKEREGLLYQQAKTVKERFQKYKNLKNQLGFFKSNVSAAEESLKKLQEELAKFEAFAHADDAEDLYY